jgi:hypothetical protein
VADRERLGQSCGEWHADGTAGKDDHSTGLVVMAPARATGEAPPRGTPGLVGKSPKAARQRNHRYRRGCGLRNDLGTVSL